MFNSLNLQVTLYKDNVPILRAERGVTLGLLKLIYSTDDSYSGILLGVKPRLSNGELPCLVTFDNTSLTYPEYDLIVQGNFCYLTKRTKCDIEGDIVILILNFSIVVFFKPVLWMKDGGFSILVNFSRYETNQ